MKFPTALQSCTGCQCCAQLCPAGAITIKEDYEGFPAPIIDPQLCTDCDLCAQRCPVNHVPNLNPPQYVIGARYILDDAKLAESASGGAGYALAEYFLNGGNAAVYGSTLDADNVCRHIEVNRLSELHYLQSSKYVQSDIGIAYCQAEHALMNGKRVLFTGTPCQIDGLYQYLGTSYESLFTVDLICHGVPSPGLFRSYIKYLEGQEKDEKIIHLNFRPKDSQGWSVGDCQAKTETRTKTIPYHKNPYMISFLRNDGLRECCYQCRYAQKNRVGDITIGDFWGVPEVCPEFNDCRGCSVALVNTAKGEQLAEILKNTCATIETTLDKVMPYQQNLRAPSPRPVSRNHLLKNMQGQGADIFRQSEFKLPLLDYWKRNIKYRMPWVAAAYRMAKKAILGERD